ncbi:MAG: rhomboid family intramembrane serine protease [Verrucomicrobiota bacterium JB025]|nr:rhomboid family intramembrane serine protease [Verrucomicrobiota bacterium JB025]
MLTRLHMGLADRDYQRRQPQPGDGYFAQLTPVVKWLLMANIAIYFLDLVLEGSFGHKPLRTFGAYAIDSAIFEFRIWEFFTFQFLHGSLGHLLFNAIGIFFFGPWMERWWGSKKFLWFYLLCGAAGAAFFTILTFVGILPAHSPYFMGHYNIPLVGASAGIYGILIGVALIAPNLRVQLLFPPVELSMRTLAIALLVISTGSIILSLGGNEGGEAGHLGGAIIGFLLVRHPWILGKNTGVEIHPPRYFRKFESKLHPRSRIHPHQDTEVDAILDKVSSQGFQSLTDEERAILQKAADQQNSNQ